MKGFSFSHLKPFHILLVEDDERLRTLLDRYLQKEGNYLVSTACHVEEALQKMRLFNFDGLVVDIMLPGQPGTFLLSKKPPVLLLSAMDKPHERMVGLELGAYDYLIKPFEPKELLLRLKKMVKPPKKTIILGNRLYCLQRKMLLTNDQVPLPLSMNETHLLHYFSMHLYFPIERHTLAKALFPETTNERIVDVQVNRLRKKIEEVPQNPRYLVSLRGKGYCLQADGIKHQIEDLEV